MRRSGDRVRVAAQLIEGASGAHLWAEKFEGAVADIFDFQDEITRSVIGLIEPQIRKAEIERARRKRPESLDAWDLYVQALPLVYGANVPGYTEAIELLDRALALDPNYAPALALASWAHEKRKTYGGIAHRRAWTTSRMSLALAQRALEADPDDAMAMALLGWERILFRWDYGGLALCSRAVELNPNNRAVLDLAAVAQLFAGDLDQVIACGMRALQLSPGAPDAYMCSVHPAMVVDRAQRLGSRTEHARAERRDPGRQSAVPEIGADAARSPDDAVGFDVANTLPGLLDAIDDRAPIGKPLRRVDVRFETKELDL